MIKLHNLCALYFQVAETAHENTIEIVNVIFVAGARPTGQDSRARFKAANRQKCVRDRRSSLGHASSD